MRIEAKDIEEKNDENPLDEKTEGSEASETAKENKDEEKEENVFADDALALAGLSFKEKRKYKKEMLAKRLATMDKKEGRKYRLYYYRGEIIATILILLLVSVVGRAVFKAAIPTPLKLIVVNMGECKDLVEYIPEHYREFFGLGNFNDFQINTGFNVSQEDEGDMYVNSMSDLQKISFYCDPSPIGSDMIDVILVEKTAMMKFLENGDITTIDGVLPDELYGKIKDDVITTDDIDYKAEDGASHAIAIDISNTEFVKKCNLHAAQIYIIIPRCKTKGDTHVENFVRFIYGYK